jgi:transcriptional regulator of acetoin/glycerol metabolism
MLNSRPAEPFDQRATMRAWERLLSGETTDLPAGVRPEILRSWQRCQTGGTDALAAGAPSVPRPDTPTRSCELLEAASDTLDQLGRLLDGTGAMLLLCDGEGVVIRAMGDPSTREKGREINLEVGGRWDEEAIGTNGIGTAIREGFQTGCECGGHRWHSKCVSADADCRWSDADPYPGY